MKAWQPLDLSLDQAQFLRQGLLVVPLLPDWER